MKKFALLLLIAGLTFLSVKQYKFNLQVEWWAHNNGVVETCQYWEEVIPAEAKAELATKEITKASFNDWMSRVKEDERKACDEAHRFHSTNPYMPFTDKWVGFTVETKLNSISGYLKDLFKEPYKEQGMWPIDIPPTVKLKNHWYGGGDAECVVAVSDVIHGMPLPGLTRRVYSLDCKNDKSNKEGIGGFVAVSTSDNMSPLPVKPRKVIMEEKKK